MPRQHGIKFRWQILAKLIQVRETHDSTSVGLCQDVVLDVFRGETEFKEVFAFRYKRVIVKLKRVPSKAINRGSAHPPLETREKTADVDSRSSLSWNGTEGLAGIFGKRINGDCILSGESHDTTDAESHSVEYARTKNVSIFRGDDLPLCAVTVRDIVELIGDGLNRLVEYVGAHQTVLSRHLVIAADREIIFVDYFFYDRGRTPGIRRRPCTGRIDAWIEFSEC